MTRAIDIYRILLHCYPAAFREEYGDQMLLVFGEQLGDARQTGDRLALWAQAAWDAVTIAPREHCHVIFQDLRYALRTMAAGPGFAAVAILSLALGIGANSAIFSLWNGVLHSSLPGVYKPEELAILTNPGESGSWHGSVRGDRNWLSYPEFRQLRDQAKSFSGMMASQSGLANWQIRFAEGGWEVAQERLVSGEYFRVLGVRPAVGQVFTAEDDAAAIPHAVISYDYWQRRFGGSADVLGKTFSIATLVRFSAPLIKPTAELTIVGVAPRGFIGETAGQRPDFWIPLQMQTRIVPFADWLHDKAPEKVMWLQVFGRLKPGVTLARAGAEANTIFKNELEVFYGSVASAERKRGLMNQRLKVQPGGRGASRARSDYSTSLSALLAAVGLLLLIACANLANLQLARGTARRPEMALRLSLGASRGRLIRQLLTESLLLAGLGGVAGIAIAYFLHGALVRMIVETDRNFRMNFSLDPLLLIFTLTVTGGAALLFGLLPAWQATKTDAGSALKEQSRGGVRGIGRMRWGRTLVSLQLALSAPLVAGAGLLAQTLYNLQHAELGYPARHLLLVRADLQEAGKNNEQGARILRELAEQLQAIPGVRAVSFSGLGLFSGGESTSTIAVEGFAARQESDRESAMDEVGPRYFSTLKVPITQGREILERDREGMPKVCVINQAFVDRFFAGRNAIGMHVTAVGDGTERTAYQVVGVARDARTQSLRDAVAPRYFVATQQDPGSKDEPTFLIRTAGESAPVVAALRQAFRRVDATLAIGSVHSIEEQLAPLTAQDRTTAQLAIVFGIFALALASIGLYGVVSYGIARRTGEIAIRMALGAKPGGVIAMILRETTELVMVGLAIGTGAAYAASRLIHSRLYGVTPQDPFTLTLATLTLLIAAFCAAYWPARRASKLDPLPALHQE